MLTSAVNAGQCRRWTVRRKAEVLSALLSGNLSVEEACARYHLVPRELGEWWRACNGVGLSA